MGVPENYQPLHVRQQTPSIPDLNKNVTTSSVGMLPPEILLGEIDTSSQFTIKNHIDMNLTSNQKHHQENDTVEKSRNDKDAIDIKLLMNQF